MLTVEIIKISDRPDLGECVFCGNYAQQYDLQNRTSYLVCSLKKHSLPCWMKTMSCATSDAANLAKHWKPGGLLPLDIDSHSR
jgi:hypothetical protein